MQEFVTRIGASGRVTVPAAVRHHLGVRPGDQIVFRVADDGSISIAARRFPTIQSLRGIAGSLAHPLTWEEVQEIAHEERAEQAM